ncbi:hypothetical protein G6L37_04495 [Agrobacterium rubi]|nr:hypothetical protein [Agrobacterium rubi]NTF24612.1 hypothetical protein [Agrobacterium rubi]
MVSHVAQTPRSFTPVGYEPDPIKRIEDAYCDIRIPSLPMIDVEALFKKIPPDVVLIKAAQVGYGATYGEF